MVLLKRVAKAADFSEQRLKEIQSAHLAHLSWLHDQGYTHVAGPFEVAADYPLRGIVLYRGDLTIDKVKELAEMDPAVKAGRLQVEILKWWIPAGKVEWKK